MSHIQHHGIKGQRWGIRRFQREDGTRTLAGKKRERVSGLSKKDERWVKKHTDKLTDKTKKAVSKDLNKYAAELARNPESYTSSGRLSSRAITDYNRRTVELMNKKISGLQTPSGRVVSFVAKRGEIGVYMAIADQGYNIDQLKNGIFKTGKVAYRDRTVNRADI